MERQFPKSGHLQGYAPNGWTKQQWRAGADWGDLRYNADRLECAGWQHVPVHSASDRRKLWAGAWFAGDNHCSSGYTAAAAGDTAWQCDGQWHRQWDWQH